MPNHCDQDLFVYGDEVTLREFQEFSKERDSLLSANKYIPYPEKYKKQDEVAEIARLSGNYDVRDGFNSGGYEWCCQNWGTKWGIYSCALKEEKFSGKRSSLKYNFESAWSPANKIILAMGQKFPTLRFKLKYYEMGAQFKGTFEVKNGMIHKNEQSTYKGRRGG